MQASRTSKASSNDVVPMDIDATHSGSNNSHMDWIRTMRGCCYGCGSKDHSKKDGNHGRDLCPYCKWLGHKEAVCSDKFMGLERDRGLHAQAPKSASIKAAEVAEPAPASSSSNDELLAKICASMDTLAAGLKAQGEEQRALKEALFQ